MGLKDAAVSQKGHEKLAHKPTDFSCILPSRVISNRDDNLAWKTETRNKRAEIRFLHEGQNDIRSF